MSADTGPAIELRGASKIFRTPSGDPHTAVSGLDLTVEAACSWPSSPPGCGKSTTLTLVSGLEELMECEAVVPDEPLDLREGTCDSVVFGARVSRSPRPRRQDGLYGLPRAGRPR